MTDTLNITAFAPVRQLTAFAGPAEVKTTSTTPDRDSSQTAPARHGLSWDELSTTMDGASSADDVFRAANGASDVGVVLAAITAAFDGNHEIRDFLAGDIELLKKLSDDKTGTFMNSIKERLSAMNAARDAYTGVMDSIAERRKSIERLEV